MTDLSLLPKESRSIEPHSAEVCRSKLSTTTTEAEVNVIQIDPQEGNNDAAASRGQVLSPNHDTDEQRNSTASAITAIPMTSEPGANPSYNHKRNVERPSKSLVLDPSGSLFHHWSMVVSLAFLYNFWSLSYRFAFQEIDFETVVVWFALDYSADFIYILDVVINFHTGYLEDGVLQRNIDKISVHYRECTQFYLDCFCLLPLDILYLSIGFNSILRCTRLVKIYKFWSYVERAERHTNYPNIFRTFTLVHYILVIFHWNACIFHMISKNKLIDIENLYKINDNHCDDILCQYLKAFYWSTLALTTVGDLPRPRTKGEYIYVTVELFFGLFLFASVLGYVANIVFNVSAARKEFQAKLDAVKTFMRMRRVSDELQSKVIRWFDYLWISQKSSDEDKSVACLPDRLKAEIAIHVHLDTLKRVDIFQNTEAGFLCELVLRLKPVLFSPGDYVCRKNEVGHEMYIVSRGILEVVTNEGKTVVATLKAGSYFGEISMLNVGPAGNRRTASVRSVGYSDLFCLNKQDLWDVLKNYPNAEARIRARAEERLLKLSDPNKPRKLNSNESPRAPNSVKSVGLNQNQPNQSTQEINRSGHSDSYTGSLLVSSNLRQATSCSSTTTGGGGGLHRRRVCSSSSCSKPTKFIAACSINELSNSTIDIESTNLGSNIAGKRRNPTKIHKVLCTTRRCLGCNARLNNNELIAETSTVPKNDLRDCELEDSSNGKTDLIGDEDLNECDGASDDGLSESVSSEDYEEDDNLLHQCPMRTPAKSRSDCFGLKSIKSSRGLACVCVKHATANDGNKLIHPKSRLIGRRPNVGRKPVLAPLYRRNQVFIGADAHLDDDQRYDQVSYGSPVGHSRSFDTGCVSGQTILSPTYHDNSLANKTSSGTDASRFLEPNDRRQQHRHKRSESFSVKSIDSSLSGYLYERRRNRQLLFDQLSPQPALNETLAGRFDQVNSRYPPMRRIQQASPSESVPDSAKSVPNNQQIHMRPIQRTQHGSIHLAHLPFKECPPAKIDEGSHHYTVQLVDASTIKQSTGGLNQLIASGHSSTPSPLDTPSHAQIPVQGSVAQPGGQYLRVPVAISTDSNVSQSIPSQQTVPTTTTTAPIIQSRSMSQLTPIQLIAALPSSPHANLSMSLNPISEVDSRVLLQGQKQYLILSTVGQPDSDPQRATRVPEITKEKIKASSQSEIAQVSIEEQEQSSQHAMICPNDSRDSDTTCEQMQAEFKTNSAQNRDALFTSSNTDPKPSDLCLEPNVSGQTDL